MAKGGYVGTVSSVKKIRQGWVGTTSGNKKIKKGWVGTASGNKLIYGSFPPEFYGVLSPLSSPVWRADFAKNNSFAIIACGQMNGTDNYTSSVNAYNIKKVKSTPYSRSISGMAISTGTTADGQNAIFYGGWYDDGGRRTWNYHVDFYNSSLVKTVKQYMAEQYMSTTCATNNNFALFGGGTYAGYYTGKVKAINNSMISMDITALTEGRSNAVTGSAGQYGIFMAGSKDYENVGAATANEAYNSSNVKTILSSGNNPAIYNALGGTIGNKKYAICGQGQNDNNGTTYHRKMYAYNASLVRSDLADATYTRNNSYEISGTEIDGKFLLIPIRVTSSIKPVIDVYDESLIKSTVTNFISPNFPANPFGGVTIGSFGEYILQAGGQLPNNGGITNQVYCYSI